jgi:hypothetical protein
MIHLVCQGGGRKKQFAEDEDFDESDEGSELTDSEFEDPDEMEVPMGGKTLGAASKNLGATKDEDASDDDIKVISDNGHSNGKPAYGQFPGRLGGAGMSITPVNQSSLLKTKAEDPGFEIIKEVPGNTGMPRMQNWGLGASGGLQVEDGRVVTCNLTPVPPRTCTRRLGLAGWGGCWAPRGSWGRPATKTF